MIQSKKDKQSIEEKYIENDIDDHRDVSLLQKLFHLK